ncbi:MAG: thiamine pyrophosphate-binding protein [Betaproteobacteria bacterium]|nr:thiamine pyrophosphate-binding protein [Betaproteobacteria bacterium]
MAKVNGSQILARALRKQRVDTMFYIMGGPMLAAESACIEEGIRAIDVRHEQAAAMMAHAWGRMLNRVGVCMAASGPGTTNLVTGVVNAWADAAPLLAIGGSAPAAAAGRGQFQEMDQVGVFKPITKWAERVLDPRRIPDMVATAMRQAVSGCPGPVYLDMPGDVLYQEIDEDQVVYPDPARSQARARPTGDAESVREAIRLLERAERPILISGSGILWSEAWDELRRFVELAGIPFYTTPQGRGVIPDDHELSFLTARSSAFSEADLLLVVGTRANYVSGHLTPPRFRADAKLIQVNIDPGAIGLTRSCDSGIVGDAKVVLKQLAAEGEGRLNPKRYSAWVKHLAEIDRAKTAQAEAKMSTDQAPIHPLRLCKEVRDFLDRDAILVVDGQEILNYGRQSIPTFVPGHRLNSGAFGTMGVGLPFGIGAKVARPDKQVLVLHGDGSFGLNAMELDTAVRFKIPVVTVISLNGGWTGDAKREKPGRDLGYTRYDKMAEGLGCHGEYVEDAANIRPALERAFRAGIPALVNVKTDFRARATTARFSVYTT